MVTEVLADSNVPPRSSATSAIKRDLVLVLPELIAVGVAGFAIPAMILLLLGAFIVPVVIGVGALGAVVAIVSLWTFTKPTERRRSDRLWALAALAVALGFVAINAKYSAQDLYANRDAATYTLTGQWLAQHHNLHIPNDLAVFGNTPGISDFSPGFRTDLSNPGHVYAQGNHLLPAFLGVAGWLGGPEALLRTNALLGGLAIFVLFGLVRRFAGSGFAAAAAAALAVSMPMAAFSRNTFSEPVTLLLIFGGLAILWRAIESGRRPEFLLAGLTIGAAAMARIDVYAALYGVIVVAVVLLASARSGERRLAGQRVGLLLGGTIFAASLGFLDVTRLSSGYYHDERDHILPLLQGALLLLILGAVVVLVAWRTRLINWLSTPTVLNRLAIAGGGAVIAFFAVLISRPLWLVDHGDCVSGIAGLQANMHLPVDPCRTYNEHTVNWFAWYFGWPTVVLAVLGLSLLAAYTIKHRDLRLSAIVVTVLALSGLYFVRASIVPDQVWAMRRFLPVVIPGLLGAAAFLLYRLSQRNKFLRIGAVGVAALMIVIPAWVTYPMLTVRQAVPELHQVQAVCNRIGKDAAVISLGVSGLGSYVQAERSFCGVPSADLPEPSTEKLASAYAAATKSGKHLYITAEKFDSIPTSKPVSTDQSTVDDPPKPFSIIAAKKFRERVIDVPQSAVIYYLPVYLGEVNERGEVTQITE